MAGLDKKTTELVLIALLTMERWKTGLQVHAKMATAAGCTAEEVRGAALITLAVRGLPECSEALGWLDRGFVIASPARALCGATARVD